MAEMVLKNVKVYIGGYDLSGSYNSVTLRHNADMNDKTTFGSSARKRVPGLRDVELMVNGFYNASSSKQADFVHFSQVGTTGREIAVVPEGSAVGNVAYFANACLSEYSPGGNIGELMGFNIAAYSHGAAMVRGRVAESGLRGTSYTMTPVSLGARTTKQMLYASHQCLGLSSAGAKVTVSIQISSASGFGTITTALKFTATTAANKSDFKSTACSTEKPWTRAKVTGVTSAAKGTMMITFGLQRKHYH